MLNSTQAAGQGGRLGFADWLTRVCGRSTATAKSYERDAAAYVDWSEGQGLALRQALNRAQLGLYLMERMDERRRWAGEQQKLGARSAARIVSALRMYQAWLRFNGELDGADGFDPEPPKYSRRLPDYHNTDEMQALVSAWDGERGPLALRNAAMLHLLYATGIRASELCGLNIGDIEPRARLVRVRGKGNRERVVPYGAKAAAALEQWLSSGRPLLGDQGPGTRDQTADSGDRGSGFGDPQSSQSDSRQRSAETGNRKPATRSAETGNPDTGMRKPETGNPKPDALFLNHRGSRLTRRGLHDVVDKSALKAGILKSVSSHKLRHACATHLLEGGADVRLVQELLGHQSLATTQVYTQVTRTQLLDAFDKAHPRAKK
ncbi:MAG: tyrosine-type recombinase/integrase [Planctomycetales bacterium]|nr:tyrosine-type recombinase/integrase [bacterium]UNM06872.1 MAG: tyrosine-type recombinase/integrase [Planctomycetales bacterium]